MTAVIAEWLETARPAPAAPWVPVSERLPEPYEEIWITYDDGTVEDAIESKNIVISRSDAIAWMPKQRPEPYRAAVEAEVKI